jgi:DNA-binding phage protein
MSAEMTKQIQDAIRATGLPLLEVARRTGVSQPQLYRFMNNTRTLTLPAVEKLCKALGLELRPSKQPKPKGKR